MDTSGSRTARDEDSRDNRTWQDERPHPAENRDVTNETRSVSPSTQDPVNAVNPAATPSDYTMDDIEEGETPLDEEMDSMVDPSIGRERMSTNPDVLDLDGSWRGEGEEPDFMTDPGTTDVIESIEEGEPFFPPTDPVLRRERRENVGVLGGFSSSSLEEPREEVELPPRVQTNDEELAERVRDALASDAYTSDLNIEVDVDGGIVYLTGQVRSLEDIEQAEQVAGSVAGVDDVEESLEIV